MPAGPSELLVIADSKADPRYVVSDLLSQAEHGEDFQVVLVLVGNCDIEEYQAEMHRQASVLPRKEIVKVSISKSYILNVDSMDSAMEFSNQYAPEHLILNVQQAEKYVSRVMNAGSIFVGEYSPERYFFGIKIVVEIMHQERTTLCQRMAMHVCIPESILIRF